MAEEENDELSEVPEVIEEMLKGMGIFIAPDLSEDERTVYQRALEGKCMTCDGPLGQNTMICVNGAGIVMVYCQGACLTDMQVMGYLQEQHDDHVQKIKFRGGKIDPDPR